MYDKADLTFNMLVKRHSDFLALGFLTGADVIGTLGMPTVTSSTRRSSDLLYHTCIGHV